MQKDFRILELNSKSRSKGKISVQKLQNFSKTPFKTLEQWIIWEVYVMYVVGRLLHLTLNQREPV